MRRPQNLKKNLLLALTKQLFLLSSVKTSGRFFQIFVPFSEKLIFTIWGPPDNFFSKVGHGRKRYESQLDQIAKTRQE